MLPALAAILILQSPAEAARAEVIRSHGVAAYVVGLCERFVSPESARRTLDALSMADQPESEARTLIVNVTARMYLDGQRDPRRKDLTPEVCETLARQAADGMGSALARVRAIEAAEP